MFGYLAWKASKILAQASASSTRQEPSVRVTASAAGASVALGASVAAGAAGASVLAGAAGCSGAAVGAGVPPQAARAEAKMTNNINKLTNFEPFMVFFLLVPFGMKWNE